MLVASRHQAHPAPRHPGPSSPAGARENALPWDLQAASSLNHFMTELTDSAMFPAFLAGGLASRALRLGAVGNWVASPTVKTLSSLFARQTAASTLALGGEVLAFTGAHRAAVSLLRNGGTSAPELEGLGTELTGTGIMLGSLRSFGLGFGVLGGMLQRAGLGGATTQGMLSTLGSYTGLLAAQQADRRLLHPNSPEIEDPFSKAAVSLLHFTGFGLMARHITPRAWSGLETSLEQKTQALLEQKLLQIKGLPLGGGARELAWQATGLWNPFSRPETLSIVRSQGPAAPAARGQPNLIEFSARLSLEQRALVTSLFQNLSVEGQKLSETLAQSELIGTERFDLALRRLHHVSAYTPAQGAESSYINWVTRLGFERIIEKGDAMAADQMMTMITQPTPRPEYEKFLSELFPEGRLPPPPPPSRRTLWDLLKRKDPALKALEALPVSSLAKTNLRRWYASQSQDGGSALFFIPKSDFLNLLTHLKKMKDPPKWTRAVAILERAGSSPIGLLKIHRLFQILQSEMKWDPDRKVYTARGYLGTKLRELVDDKFRFEGKSPETPDDRTPFAYGAPGGHLGQYGPAQLLRPMLTQWTDLLDPVKQKKRTERRQEVLRQFLTAHPEGQAYTQENLAEAFESLHGEFGKENYPIELNGERGDFSHHVAKDLKDGQIKVEALPDGAYQSRFHKIKEDIAQQNGRSYKKEPVHHQAFIFNFGEKRTLLLKITKPSGGQRAEDAYFEDLRSIVHDWWHSVEYRTFNHGRPVAWTEGAQLKQEAATHTAQHWFEAQHGDAKMLEKYFSEGLGGFMMRFLDHYEKTYQKYWRS